MIEEVWKEIPEFSDYQISNLGRIFNGRRNTYMRTSMTKQGHVKITLRSDWSSERFTRSVAQLVAEAFVRPPNVLCDHVVVLDGDHTNLAAHNLVWRPRSVAWQYTRQLRVPQPLHYRNLHVTNMTDNVEYESIIQAGMMEGLLFDDIWRSTYMGTYVYPTDALFEITERE